MQEVRLPLCTKLLAEEVTSSRKTSKILSSGVNQGCWVHLGRNYVWLKYGSNQVISMV